VERFDLWIKAGIGIIGGIVSIFIGVFGLFFTILVGMMALDFISGVFAAIVTGEKLKSQKGYKGLFKKLYVLLLIGAVLMLEVSILQTNGVITDGVSSAFILMEFVSIIENGSKMGLNLGFLNKIVDTVKAKVPLLDESNDKKTEEK
jgi:toxin secretion/phage lysis holin